MESVFFIIWKDMRTCIFVFIFLTYLILLVAAQSKRPAFQQLHKEKIKKPNISKNISICDQQACWKLGQDIKQSMNRKVNPCDNFYEFVCGNWKNRFPDIATKPFFNRIERAKNAINLQLKEIIEEQPRNEIRSLKKAKVWHKMCIDDETLKRIGVEPIKTTLQKLRGWPTIFPHWVYHDWQDINDYYTTLRSGSSSFFNIQAMSDPEHEAEKLILKLTPPKFLIPEYVLLDFTTHEQEIGAYDDFFRTVVDTFLQSSNIHVDQEVITTDLIEMMTLEMQLTQIANRERPVVSHSRTMRMTIIELQRRYDQANDKNNPKTQINWLNVFQNVLDLVGIVIDPLEEVYVTDIDYFENLAYILKNATERAIVNHIHWQFVVRWIHYTTPVLRELLQQFKKEMFSVANDVPRWLSCIKSNPYDRAIIYEFLRRHVPDVNKDLLLHILANVRSALDQQISNAVWMDKRSKDASRAKLMSMTAMFEGPSMYRNSIEIDKFYDSFLIAFDDFFQNIKNQKRDSFATTLKMNGFERLENEIWVNMLDINAVYHLVPNVLFVYAPLLAPPLFTSGPSKILQLYNYASVGYVVSHETGHAFDDDGMQYIQFSTFEEFIQSQIERIGRLFTRKSVKTMFYWRFLNEHRQKTPLWSVNTNERFEEKKSCFVEQFNSYDIPGIRNETTGQPIKENGERTFNENLADSIGLRAAFAGFQKASQNLQLERLPYLEEYDHNQLFFISYANLWCEYKSQNFLRTSVLNKNREHSESCLRTNGVVSNMVEFSKAFKCKPNDKMNRPQKCKLW